MTASPSKFLDANVVMYALGGSHPLRSPCKAILERIRDGSLVAVINTEVLQEVLYRYFSIAQRSLGELAYSSLVDICEQVLPVTLFDTDRALALLKAIPRITPRDAIHAATMINNGIKEIYSADPHFDLIPEIRRIPPA